MKVLNVLDKFQITGRGTVFVVKCSEWFSKLNTDEVFRDDFNFVENGITNSYTITGVEQRVVGRRINSVAEPDEMIGILVKEN